MNKNYHKTLGEGHGGALCPTAQSIVDMFNNIADTPACEMDIDAARSEHALQAYDVVLQDVELQVNDLEVGVEGHKISMRIYTPSGPGPFPIVVFAHGGCWTFCSLDSHDRICRYLAHHTPCIVVSVDYALAPESPFPQGLEDFTRAVEWCFENAEEINGNSKRVAVAGDSAGGNLAAVTAQRMQNDPLNRLCLQLLIYPICDVSKRDDASMLRYEKGYFFTRDMLDWTVSHYVVGYNRMHPEISPLYGEVKPSLAPAMIIVAECDILSDQALAYAQKLHAAGVLVKTNLYRGVPHAFVAMAGALELGAQALEDVVIQLRQTFYGNNQMIK